MEDMVILWLNILKRWHRGEKAIMNKDDIKIISNEVNELMKNVKINMSLSGGSAASAIIGSVACISTVVIYGIKIYGKLESKKMVYNYECEGRKDLGMIVCI